MNFLHRKWHSTIRVRLTVLYATGFFLAGLALIGLMYFQLNQVIGARLIFNSIIIGPRPEGGLEPNTVFRLRRLPGGAETPAEDTVPSADQETGEIPGPPALPDRAEIEARLRTARTEALQSILVVSVISLLAVSAVAAVFGWLLAGQALRPLRKITATARSIADRNLHRRIAMEGPADEIKDLADTLDDMLERLDRAFDSQQRFIANASHELRTPLAINRTLIEVALMKASAADAQLRQLGSTLLAVNQRHEHLIDGLLMLAGSEQEIADPREVELAEIARHVLGESAAMAQSARIELRSHLEPAPCTGDGVLLERLLHNLVDNAIRYNLPESGWIEVTTGTNPQRQATITVENTGPLIPAHEVPRLFEPFRRLSSTERLADSSGVLARRGAGLGLSIVRSIVTSHGGEVNAAPREGGGLVVNIVLPCTDQNFKPQ